MSDASTDNESVTNSLIIEVQQKRTVPDAEENQTIPKEVVELNNGQQSFPSHNITLTSQITFNEVLNESNLSDMIFRPS